MTKQNRIVALAGVALILISIVTMLVGALLPDLRALLMNVSLISFIAALGILVCLAAIRKRNAPEKDDQQE